MTIPLHLYLQDVQAQLVSGQEIILHIKLHPHAKQNELKDLIPETNTIKASVTQAPERGKANQALINLLARYLHIKKSSISIIAGETSHNKIIKILVI